MNEPDAVERLDYAVWPIFHQMHERGILADRDRVHALLREVEEAVGVKRWEFVSEIAGRDVDPDKPAQVAAWIEDMDFPVRLKLTRSKARLATDERQLALLVHLHPAIPKLLEYRGLEKLRTAFLNPLVERLKTTDTVHPRWRLTRVASGRPAMEDPNLLAFPSRDKLGRKVRECFIARPGYRFVSFDYSQIEPRITAALSGDPGLGAIYLQKLDLYISTATHLFHTPADQVDPIRHRLPAKTVTLGVLYGMGERKLYEELIKNGCGAGVGAGWEQYFSEEECADLISDWFRIYPLVRQLVDRTVAEAKLQGGIVRTILGRTRRLPALFLRGGAWPEDKLRQEAERQGFNHLIQGTAQEVIKRAQVRVAALGRDGVYPMLQIYDDLVYEVADGTDISDFRGIIGDVWNGIPLPVEEKWGANWASLK